jgi:hypothetical protein
MAIMLFAIGIYVLTCTAASYAQLPRIQLQQKTYDVTVVSEYGFPVRVGIFGYSTRANCRIDFDGTHPDVYDQKLYAGERVVFVWDRRGTPLMVAVVTIDSDGVLVVGGPFADMPAGAPYGRAEARAGGAQPKLNLPRLRIKPER